MEKDRFIYLIKSGELDLLIWEAAIDFSEGKVVKAVSDMPMLFMTMVNVQSVKNMQQGWIDKRELVENLIGQYERKFVINKVFDKNKQLISYGG